MENDFQKNTAMQETNATIDSVSKLCDHCVWPERSLALYAYMPIGIALLISRLSAMTIIYFLSFITPQRLRVSLYKTQVKILGIHINKNASTEEIKNLTDGCLVASNHISTVDTLVSLGLPNITIMMGKPIKQLDVYTRMLYTSAIKLSCVNQWHVVDRRGLVKNIQKWRKNQSGTTLYTTPEMTLGNQRGIFKFNSAFMCFDLPVVPLAITVKNSMGMNINPVNSSHMAIALRLLMLPSIVFNLYYLDKKTQSEGESKEDFAKRVQQSIADKLGVPATDWTAADKHAYRKELSTRKH